MKVTLCRDLTILFSMLAMVTLSSAANAILREDEPVSDHKGDFVEDSSSYADPVVSQSYLPNMHGRGAKSSKRGRFLHQKSSKGGGKDH
jgi:hypothetical protein